LLKRRIASGGGAAAISPEPLRLVSGFDGGAGPGFDPERAAFLFLAGIMRFFLIFILNDLINLA
jgi:hypothetical protein